MRCHTSRWILAAAAATGLAASPACQKSSTEPSANPTNPSANQSISTFGSSAQLLGTSTLAAANHTGSPPSAAGGPSVSVATSPQAATGANNLVSIQSGAPFQTIFLSVNQSAALSRSESSWVIRALIAAPLDALFPSLHAATVQGFLQIDLSTPTTSADVSVAYATSLPSGSFDLQVQVAGANGVAGPVASSHKSVTVPAVEQVGIVFGRLILNPANPTGPGLIVDPVAGATISTSLDGATTTTNGSGAFDLKTNTPTSTGICFTLTIRASGLPTYSSTGWRGNVSTGPVVYIMQPPFPTDPISGGC